MIYQVIIGIMALFMGIFLFLIKPNSKRIDKLPANLFAHRGLHGNSIPENSLAAFTKAKAENLGVELDVQLTKDNKLVVFHDANLKRMCGVNTKVRDLTYSELKKYRLADSRQNIPLLCEVLAILEDLPVICEIKSYDGNTNTEICHYVYQDIKDYTGQVFIESFSPFIVRWFKLNQVNIIRGQLSMGFTRKNEQLKPIEAFLMKHLLINILGRPDFIAYYYEHDSLGFRLCRLVFHPLCLGWTVNHDLKNDLVERKYHGLIFEKAVEE